MRLVYSETGTRRGIVLSKRNLLALLHKLEMPGSSRTITRQGFLVTAETDAEHYAGREHGEMHPETEKFIKNYGRKVRGRHVRG